MINRTMGNKMVQYKRVMTEIVEGKIHSNEC